MIETIERSGATVYEIPAVTQVPPNPPVKNNLVQECKVLSLELAQQVTGIIYKYRSMKDVRLWVTYRTITDFTTCQVSPNFLHGYLISNLLWWLVIHLLLQLAFQVISWETYLSSIVNRFNEFYILNAPLLIQEWLYVASPTFSAALLPGLDAARKALYNLFPRLVQRAYQVLRKSNAVKSIVVAEVHFQAKGAKDANTDLSEYSILIASLHPLHQLVQNLNQELNADGEPPSKKQNVGAHLDIGANTLGLTNDKKGGRAKRGRSTPPDESHAPAVNEASERPDESFPTMIGVGKGGQLGLLCSTEDLQLLKTERTIARIGEWDVGHISALACHLSHLLNLRQTIPDASLAPYESLTDRKCSVGNMSSKQYATRVPMTDSSSPYDHFVLDRLLQTLLHDTVAFVLYDKLGATWKSTVYWLQLKAGMSAKASPPFTRPGLDASPWTSTAQYHLYAQNECEPLLLEGESLHIERTNGLVVKISIVRSSDGKNVVRPLAQTPTVLPFFHASIDSSASQIVVLSNAMRQQLGIEYNEAPAPLFLKLNKSLPSLPFMRRA